MDESADMFLLATEWPQTACLMHSGGCSIADNVTTFTVHGLWPDNYSGDDPFYCDGESFDLDKLNDLLPLMHQLWPNVYADNTAYSFWKHEWDKHGKCAVSTGVYPDQHSYFAEALAKVARYNAFQILADAGIGPSNQPLDLNMVTGVLDEALGTRFKINCQKIDNMFLIYEVEVCFGSEHTPVDCYLDDDESTFRVSSCSHTEPVYYLPIVHNN